MKHHMTLTPMTNGGVLLPTGQSLRKDNTARDTRTDIQPDIDELKELIVLLKRPCH